MLFLFQVSSKNLLKSYVPVTTHARTLWETFPHFRPLFYEKDGLNKDKYELIYHAQIFNYAFYGQLASYALIASEIYSGLEYVYKWLFPPEVVEVVTHIGPLTVNATSLSSIIVIALFNIQGIIMIAAAQTAILRVYLCEDTNEYVFVKLGLNPFKSRRLHCNAGELHLLEESPFNFLFGNHKINRENLYLRTDRFKSSHLYNNLLYKDYK